MSTVAPPFVLLDDARAHGPVPSRLYQNPVDVIVAHDAVGVWAALARLKEETRHVAGFMSYEVATALEGRVADLPVAEDFPLLWFGVFEEYQQLSAERLAQSLPDAAGGWVSRPQPRVSRQDYRDVLAKVKGYIEAGDIYQANLTFQNDVDIMGHPLAIYAGLRQRAKAGYGGVVWTGQDWVLSLSPELFFALHDGKVTTKPMKGTAARQSDAALDAEAIRQLRADPKQRAENLMIVDLLRNDLSRVAEPGSVSVPDLFSVESYPTVHQMTSTVTAQLGEGRDVTDLLTAIYPCGSITGAPKIRAMEVIGEVEAGPRGIYTGSIGRIDPNGDAAFNVAIRTLRIKNGAMRATLGLGGGIVADSREGEEWEECLAKGRFVADPRRFDLVETMRFDPAGGIMLLDRHIARMGESARAFGIPFDRHNARNQLQAATFRIAGSRKVRLMLSASGQIAIEIGLLPPAPEGAAVVALTRLSVSSDDFRLRHKTTDRAFYDEARKASGCFEVAFVDGAGFLTEGSFTNLFVKGDGVLLTPPLSRGLLPGVLRAEMIETGLAQEAELKPSDLGQGFFIGNGCRGLLPATLKAL